MDYVRHGKIQGRSQVFFKAHCPCILPCLTQSIGFGNRPIAEFFQDQTICIADCKIITIGHSLADTIITFELTFGKTKHWHKTKKVIDVIFNEYKIKALQLNIAPQIAPKKSPPENRPQKITTKTGTIKGLKQRNRKFDWSKRTQLILC